MLYENLTYEILGCCYKAHNEIGLGYPERAYQVGLETALQSAELAFKSQYSIPVNVGDVEALTFQPDLLIENKVIVELKAIPTAFASPHYIQLFSYLKASGLDVGFLINFGADRVVHERIKYQNKAVRFDENWDYLTANQYRRIELVRRALLDVAEEHGIGYGADTYRRLVQILCSQKGIDVIIEPQCEAQFLGQTLGHHKLKCMLLDNSIICTISALQEGVTSYHIARNQSYLQNTGSEIGIHANFGKETLHIHGIRPPT